MPNRVLRVTFDRRSHNPILREAALDKAAIRSLGSRAIASNLTIDDRAATMRKMSVDFGLRKSALITGCRDFGLALPLPPRLSPASRRGTGHGRRRHGSRLDLCRCRFARRDSRAVPGGLENLRPLRVCRNAAMVAARINLCLVVHRDLARSKGTKDCVHRATRRWDDGVADRFRGSGATQFGMFESHTKRRS